MKTVTLLLILPVLALATINIDISVSGEHKPQELEITGTNEHVISNQERATFKLTDENLKAAVNAHFGSKPTDVFLRSPTPWGDLYTTNEWKQVSRILKPLKSKILSVNYHPYLVHSKVFNNTGISSDQADPQDIEPSVVRAQIWKTVENKVSSTWEKSGDISATQNIKYSLDIKGMAVTGKVGLSYNSRWGKNDMKSQKVSVGSESEVEIFLRPNQAVVAELYATKGSMKVQVDYVASLSGSVAVNYENSYKDHHFWSIDINTVLEAGGLNKTVLSSEIIDFEFYVDSNVNVRDADSDEILASLPLSVF